MTSLRSAQASDVSLLKTMIHEFAAFERLPVTVTEADLMRDGFGDMHGLRRGLRAECRRHPRKLQDMLAVLVLGDVEAGYVAVTAACGNDRNFAR